MTKELTLEDLNRVRDILNGHASDPHSNTFERFRLLFRDQNQSQENK